MTCDDYTERAKADLLSLVGMETSKFKCPSKTSKSKKRTAKRTREDDTDDQGSTKLRKAGCHLTRVVNFEVEEKILADIDKNRSSERKQGPPLLPNLATRINRYWKIEAESHSTVKHLKGLYSIPENCRELVVPKN